MHYSRIKNKYNNNNKVQLIIKITSNIKFEIINHYRSHLLKYDV